MDGGARKSLLSLRKKIEELVKVEEKKDAGFGRQELART
jgi:hypothetical protein